MEKSITEIWKDFSKILYNYINKNINNLDDSEDILQNIFMKIIKNSDKLKDIKNLSSWIFRITKNEIIDFYRLKQHKELPMSEKIDNIEIDKEIETTTIETELSNCLKNMILTLPDIYKDSLILYGFKDMKHKDIAEKLDISVSSSKVRVKRSKEKLKNLFLDCCNLKTDKYGNVLDYDQKDGCYSCDDSCE